MQPYHFEKQNTMDGIMDKDDLVRVYFKLGFSNSDILHALAKNHHIVISRRTLKRLTAKCGISRRGKHSDLLEVALFIMQQSDHSSNLHGYKWMHRKCLEAGLNVPRETVRILRLLLDPEGVAARGRSRLHRRMYHSSGPNAVWHIDGYDKLKPFGICIHGGIDGFSRYIIWMEAWSTNNDPKLIGGYFVEAVRDAGGCPERVRSDCGTENGYVQQMQCLFRHDHVDRYAGTHSFLYGRSTTNQRIESWWGILRKQCVQHWIDIFKQLQYNGFYTGDFIDKNLIRFCFMDAVQRDIKDVASVWNNHRIRASKKTNAPTGKPTVLYHLPSLCGGEDKLKPIDSHALDVCEAECRKKDDVPCDEIVFQLCTLIMDDLRWSFPLEPCNLVDLYLALRLEINTEL